MIFKYIGLLIITEFLITIKASPTEDLLLGRNYVPEESPEATFNLLRLAKEGTNVQQILYSVFTPIQAIVNIILNFICSLIPPVTSLVESFRGAVLVNLISILEVITPILSTLAPQVAIVLEVVQLVLDAGNVLLYNGTIIVQDYGCSTILGINNIVSSIVNTIIGAF